MKVRFTKHAEEKFDILEKYGFKISRMDVVRTIKSPDLVDTFSRSPLQIAQKVLDEKHVLRVVYKIVRSEKVIITFYPGRAKQYAKK